MSAQKHDFVIAACARWEADSISEWLTFQRHIGFDHVYLYCNDDDPFVLYETVLPFTQGPSPFVTFHHFGLQGQQEQMYFHFLKNYVDDCNWFSLIDIDEFILLRNHNNVEKFISSLDGRPDAVHFWSVTAGHNGHKTRPTGYALRNYTKRSNKAAPFTKVIARSSAVSREKLREAATTAFWHNIAAIMNDDAKIIDTIGNDMRMFYDGGHMKNWDRMSSDVSFHNSIIADAFLYHIAMKSEEDLIRRYNRGVGGQFYGQSQWGDLYNRGPEHISAFLGLHNTCDEYRLLEQWDLLCSGALRGQIVATPSGKNLALKCPARQSSVSIWSSSQDNATDAGGVVSGRFNSVPSHHTDIEDDPWWMVDLESTKLISQIHIYNRADGLRDRLRNFDILGSVDGEEFTLIQRKDDNVSFGGADGTPYIFTAIAPLNYRYIKIAGHGRSHLDFSQIEIY